MALTVTLAELRTRARRLADMEGKYPDDAEVTDYANESIRWVWELLLDFDPSIGETKQTINTVAGTQEYALPADYYRTLRLEYQHDSDTWERIPHVRRDEAYRFDVDRQERAWRYSILGGNLVLLPTPSAAKTYRHWYLKHATKLVNDGDSFDGINGWEELAIVDMALKMRIKEEASTTSLERRRAELLARIEEKKLQRLTEQPMRISDVGGEDDFPVDPADYRIYRGGGW